VIEALLNGKLSREQENMEDILTSCVFGLLRLIAPSRGLFPYLAHAKTMNGEQPLVDIAERLSDNEYPVEYNFWPRWEHCEPDVVLSIRQRHRQDVLLAVEAKYRSGKSSEADEDEVNVTDQLAREWRDLAPRAHASKMRPILVYLTTDVALPQADIQNSLNELEEKGGGDALTPTICWLSWRHLQKLPTSENDPVLVDIRRLVDRLGLTFFAGISPVKPIRLVWTFQGTFPTWRYDVTKIHCDWRFQT